MKLTGTFKLKELKNQHGEVYSLLLTGTKHKTNPEETRAEAKKRRVRLFFKPCKRDAANLELGRLRQEASNGKILAQSYPTRLTPPQLTDAENACNILPDGMTLTQAAEIITKAQPQILDVPLSELVDTYEKWADVGGRKPRLRPPTMKRVKQACNHFIRAHGNLRTSIIPLFNFENWRTNERNWRSMSAMFTWGARPDPKHPRYLASNPFLPLLKKMRPDAITGRPEILPNDRLQSMLDASCHMFDGLLAGPIVLLTWVVSRPNETWKTSEDFIDIEEAKVWIPPPNAKREDLGEVDLMPNALYMLEDWLSDPQHTFERAFTNWRRRLDAIKEAGGYIGPQCQDWCRSKALDSLKAWVADIFRNTGLTFHFKMTGKKGDTAAWGRTSIAMLNRCYVGKSFDRLAVLFWLILPSVTPRKDRVKVYTQTIIKLSTTRLVRALTRYLREKGIPKAICPDDHRKWDAQLIAKRLADILMAEDAIRVKALKDLPQRPQKLARPSRDVLAEMAAKMSLLKIGKKLGVSSVTAGKWCDKLKVTRPDPYKYSVPPRKVSDKDFIEMCMTMTEEELVAKTEYTVRTARAKMLVLKVKPQPPRANGVPIKVNGNGHLVTQAGVLQPA